MDRISLKTVSWLPALLLLAMLTYLPSSHAVAASEGTILAQPIQLAAYYHHYHYYRYNYRRNYSSGWRRFGTRCHQNCTVNRFGARHCIRRCF